MEVVQRRVTMGSHSYGSPVVHGDTSRVKIGKFCSIGGNVTIITHGHNPGNFSTYPFGFTKSTKKWPRITGHPVMMDVEIGNDVWIGSNTTIIGPCRIGDGVIIGAGSVVRGRIKDYHVICGNPAMFMYKRQNLLGEWWNLPEDEIKKLINK